MKQIAKSVRLPTISVFLPIDATSDDAKEAASAIITDELNLEYFEIVLVKLISEGHVQTKMGTKNGRRYKVYFRETRGEVVFQHPDYERILRESVL